MIIEHPWKTYAIAATFSALIYYVLLAWRFFLPDIRAWLKVRKRASKRHSVAEMPLPRPTEAVESDEDNTPFQDSGQGDDNGSPAWQNEELLETTQSLISHLTSEIKEAHEKHYSKQDLLLMLQMILKDYTVLRNTAFQIAVNDCINTECARYGSIRLSEGETIEVWRMVV